MNKKWVAVVLIILAISFMLFTAISEKRKVSTNARNEIANITTNPKPNQTNGTKPESQTSVIEPTSQNSKYFLHTKIFATMFWVGEDSSDENDYIPNKSSAWDKDWMEHYGGIDNPFERKGYHPTSFKPKENPFYYALPYEDFNNTGKKDTAFQIPWYQDVGEDYSLLKNRWAKVIYKNRVCYGQWEDVGPFEEDDFEYVFQNKAPKSKRAGIDLSPAMRTCLNMATNDFVSWQFIDDSDVPNGPWKEIITSSQTNWQ